MQGWRGGTVGEGLCGGKACGGHRLAEGEGRRPGGEAADGGRSPPAPAQPGRPAARWCGRQGGGGGGAARPDAESMGFCGGKDAKNTAMPRKMQTKA